MDYSRMSDFELEWEKMRIDDELGRRKRVSPIEVIVDPSMPPGELEMVSGPHRIRVTNIG